MLLVDTEPVSTFLETPDGQPVWPVGNADEHSALSNLSELFGAEVLEVSGRPAAGAANRGSDVVIGLGEGVAEATRLYAHLTKRRFRFAGGLSGLSTEAPASVVVTTTPWLSPALMDVLYTERAKTSVPGIVCADTPDMLRRQVLVRAAAAVLLGGPVEMPHVEVHTAVPVASAATPTKITLGVDAPPSEMQAALGRGAGILSVVTHCDGIDAFLGPHLTLCPMHQPPAEADRKRAPYCQETGICRRHGKSVEAAMKSGLLLPPDALSARLLLWCVCHGVLSPGGVTDPKWGLIERLLSNPRLGAIATTWQAIVTQRKSFEPFMETLLRGKSIGESLARLNRSQAARRANLRMCLFGDPRVRLPRCTGVKHARKENRAAPRANSAADREDFSDAGFLRAYLTNATLNYSGEAADLAASALLALQSYEYFGWMGGVVEGGAEAPGPVMRKAVLKFIKKVGGDICNEWLPFATLYRVAPAVACYNCGLPSLSTTYRLRVPGAARRRLRTCPRCAIIEDAPVRSAVTHAVEDSSTVLLKGELPLVNWTAGLLIECQYKPENQIWEWPAAQDGSPAKMYHSPAPWPPGPLRVSVILMRCASISVITVPSRRAPAAIV